MHQKRIKWKEISGWAAIEGHWLRRQYFTPEFLQRIADRIRQAELSHTGELVVAVEAVAPEHERDSHLRALEVFGRLRVWDTPQNTGVLLYLALNRRHIELVADRGIAASDQVWQAICAELQNRLHRGAYGPGLLAAVDAIEQRLAQACPPLPPGHSNTNDLPDKPVML